MNLPKEFFKIWNWTQLIILSHKYIFHNSRKEKWVSSMQFKGPPNHSFAHWTISILLVWSPKKNFFKSSAHLAETTTNVLLDNVQRSRDHKPLCQRFFCSADYVQVLLISWGVTMNSGNLCFKLILKWEHFWFLQVLLSCQIVIKKISEPLLLSCATNKK